MARIETLKQRGSAPAKITSIFPFISILPVARKTCDCPQNLHAKKSTFFFLFPQKNKLQQLSALFIWRRVRRMYEAIFIKAGSLSGHAHFHPSSLLIGQQQLRGRPGRFPEVARGGRWFMAATPSWTSFPPLWCNADPTTDSVSGLFPVFLIYKSNFCCLSAL